MGNDHGNGKLEKQGKAGVDAELFLTEEEVCEWLHISREGLLRLKRDKLDPIPARKYGRRFVYLESEVKKWGERQYRRYRDRTQEGYRRDVVPRS